VLYGVPLNESDLHEANENVLKLILFIVFFINKALVVTAIRWSLPKTFCFLPSIFYRFFKLRIVFLQQIELMSVIANTCQTVGTRAQAVGRRVLGKTGRETRPAQDVLL
jgi:hypothetical protein